MKTISKIIRISFEVIKLAGWLLVLLPLAVLAVILCAIVDHLMHRQAASEQAEADEVRPAVAYACDEFPREIDVDAKQKAGA